MKPVASALCWYLLGTGLAFAQALPTVIVDAHGLGPQRLAALKQDADVRWAAEFGNELLLGLDPEALPAWLGRERVRAGLGELAMQDIWVRDHACSHQDARSRLGVVGGYEILRVPAALMSHAQRAGMAGAPLPADGVQAREVLNQRLATQKRAPDPQQAEVVARVDADRWFATMEQLSLFNRNSFNPELSLAHDWILEQFIEVNLVPETFSFVMQNLTNCGAVTPPPINLSNPIGRKRGLLRPDEWIVVGAHYDSRNSARCDGGTLVPQPGANDNASGCAGVIELARVFADLETERSILFMCFSGEEQGLFGSLRYVQALQASGEIAKVRHMINLDMIGFDPGGPLDARVETNSANTALLATYTAAAATYAPELNIITSSNTGAASDHWHFLGAGVPAVFTWENGAAIYTHYHQATDIPANMTNARPLAGGILKMDAAVLAQQAMLLPPLLADGFE